MCAYAPQRGGRPRAGNGFESIATAVFQTIVKFSYALTACQAKPVGVGVAAGWVSVCALRGGLRGRAYPSF